METKDTRERKKEDTGGANGMEEYSSENRWKRVYKGRVAVQGAVVVLVKIGIRKVTKKAQFAQNQAGGRDRGGADRGP